jgi:hypothetical protein
LNIDGKATEPVNPPDPSVIVMTHDHMAGQVKRPHTAFIAFEKTALKGATNIDLEDVVDSTDHLWVRLKNETISITGNTDTKREVKFAGVANMTQYAQLGAGTDWNRDYIPETGKHPPASASEVGGYMRIENGHIKAVRLAKKKKWYFGEIKDEKKEKKDQNKSDPKEKAYARGVSYQFATNKNNTLTIDLTSFDEDASKTRQLVLEDKGGLKVWIGSTLEEYIINEIKDIELTSSEPSRDFEFYYKQIKTPTTVFVPYPDDYTPPDPREYRSPDVGYCGPDSKP